MYRTANLQSCILYIYSTNVGTDYFKHVIYSKFFPLQNAVCFIILTYLVPVLFAFYIQDVLKLKKSNSGAKRLNTYTEMHGQQNVKIREINRERMDWNNKTHGNDQRQAVVSSVTNKRLLTFLVAVRLLGFQENVFPSYYRMNSHEIQIVRYYFSKINFIKC